MRAAAAPGAEQPLLLKASKVLSPPYSELISLVSNDGFGSISSISRRLP